MTLRLLLGRRPSDVPPLLTELANGAKNAYNGTAQEMLYKYVDWSADAVRRLSNYVPASEVERLVLTRRHWALLDSDTSDTKRLNSLVQAELTARQGHLSAEAAQLSAEIDRWAALPGRLLIPDTNVFLHHHQEFVDIDWFAVVDARPDEDVEVVVPQLVVDELDKAKRGNARSRARTALRELNKYVEDASETVTIQERGDAACRVHLWADDLEHTPLAVPDSEIIDRSLVLAALVGRPVHVVTIDTGMALRARMAGALVIRVEDEGA
jgi:rRNA-processing protein FCF1